MEIYTEWKFTSVIYLFIYAVHTYTQLIKFHNNSILGIVSVQLKIKQLVQEKNWLARFYIQIR